MSNAMIRRITVIIPVKNEEDNIAKCIYHINSSICDNQCVDIIVVDNGSSDRTVEIAKECNATVYQLLYGTISELRNLGANHASGEVLAFVDADVYVHKTWLANALRCFEETEAICVGCSPEIPINSTWVERAWHYQIQVRPDRCERSWLASMNMLVKREYFYKIGGFESKLYTCEDVDFGYRLSTYGKIVFDKSIKATHYGEAKTVRAFFLKESWRGASGFQGIIHHGIKYEEMPSLIMTLIYTMAYPMMIVGAATTSHKLIITYAILTLIIPMIKTARIVKLPIQTSLLLQIYVIWLVYCYARGWSIIRYVNKIKYGRRRRK